MFTESTDTCCYVQKYPNEKQMGQFISEDNRIGLAFSSEKQKFDFKECLSLKSNAFMDMGPGYEKQMHFNDTLFPGIEGASMPVTITNN